MRLVAIAFILLYPVCTTPAGDWEAIAPPAPPMFPQAGPWDAPAAAEPPPPVKPRDEFANLLKQVEPTSDPWLGLRYEPARLKLTRESIVETAKFNSSVDFADHRELRNMPWRGADMPAPAAFQGVDHQGAQIARALVEAGGRGGGVSHEAGHRPWMTSL